MKAIIYEKLKQKVQSGELTFGMHGQIKEFTLNEFYEREDKSSIDCVCGYIEDGKMLTKVFQLHV